MFTRSAAGLYPFPPSQTIVGHTYSNTDRKALSRGKEAPFSAKKALNERFLKSSKDDGDQSTGPLIYNSLKGFLQLVAGVFRNHGQFRLDSLPHDGMKGTSENVRLPDAQGILLKIPHQIVDQLFALPFGADDRGKLGMDIH